MSLLLKWSKNIHLNLSLRSFRINPDQDQWLEMTWIMVQQMKRCILFQGGFISSIDLLWSEWSRITDPDPDHPNGTHPTNCQQWDLDQLNYAITNEIGVFDWPYSGIRRHGIKPLGPKSNQHQFSPNNVMWRPLSVDVYLVVQFYPWFHFIFFVSAALSYITINKPEENICNVMV